jgi:hypothetical protein
MINKNISISDVYYWAGTDESKWQRLVGCYFVHATYGSIFFREVDFPYLIIGNRKFTLENHNTNFLPFFQNIVLENETLANEITQHPEELRRLAKERQLRIAKEDRENAIKYRIKKLLSEEKFDAATKLYESDCMDWWSQDDFLKEKVKVENRLLEAKRKKTKNEVLAFLENADFDAATKLYESDCIDWWSQDDFLKEKVKVENRLLEAKRNKTRNEVLSFLENADFDAATKLYESDCMDWWSQDDFLKKKSSVKIRTWCKDNNLIEDEITNLIHNDKDRARVFAKLLLENRESREQVIPRCELEWATLSGANKTVAQYVESNLYKSIAGVVFETSINCELNYIHSLVRGSLHEYVRRDDRPPDDQHSGNIIKYKYGNMDWVYTYAEELENIIAPKLVVCCAPSSSMDEWGTGLEQTVRILGKRENRQSFPKLLRRTKTIPSSKSGTRSKKLHLETIEVTDPSVVKDRPVVVIDDITTSGSTLAACSELLWLAGCNCVGAIAIGGTVEMAHRSSQFNSRPRQMQPTLLDLDDEIPF